MQLKRTSGTILFFTIAAFCLCVLVALAATSDAAAGPAAFSPDKGKFKILLNGQSFGSEQFELAQTGSDWVAEGTTEVTVPGSSTATHISGSLRLQPDGAPVSYEWTSRADKTNGAHITFVNGVAKITLEMQGARPFEQDLTFNAPLIAVLDNNLYHHYALLPRIYDWAKRGAQSFPD